MRIKSIVPVGLLCLLVTSVPALAQDTEEWEFDGVTRIIVDGLSGDVIIRPGGDRTGVVRLRSDVRPRNAFRPRVEQDGRTLRIEEDWERGSSRGPVEWTIYLPRGGREPRIEVSTSSGDLDGKGVAIGIDFKSSSGDINLTDVELVEDSRVRTSSGDYALRDMRLGEDSNFSTSSGDIVLNDVEIEEGFRISTSSGDIECRGCAGFMRLSTSSGDVLVTDSVIDETIALSSSSGDVVLRLDELPREDVVLSSSSGNVLLDVADFGRSYTLILTKRQDRGRIVCPFDFTSERTFRRGSQVYEEKVVERGSGGPEIELSTSSGKVVVRN